MRSQGAERSDPTAELATDTLIDGRYRVGMTLGKGGLAVVYEVHDLHTGTAKALKLMVARERPDSQRRNVELFEREFHTLMQLAHPCTVTVHEYGFDGSLPYYTMELLDGGDLFERAPLEWRNACSLARDVCSALSLLHSRRLVYRDLSPRNVRCTSAAQAKLIDFGAVVPMGPNKQVVGTASFCAPEVLELQPLDGRTDLYGLGATLYFALTGRRPYPARDFHQLREAWHKAPSAPSAFEPSIPVALDELVLSLLQLDPALRPGSAAEVMERLSGIAGLAIDENLLVSQAYLATPVLVGMDTQLARIRKWLARAATGRGSACLVSGAPGSGRSRLLAACALEAQLAGVAGLRADADDGQRGDYGVLKALLAQAFERLPAAALAAARPLLGTLSHLIPELLQNAGPYEPVTFTDSAEFRRSVQAAVQTFFETLALGKPLVVAVDDMHRSDEPSVACIALLSRTVAKHRLLIVASADESELAATRSLSVFAESASRLELQRLNHEETRSLLVSVFGEVPHLELIAEKVDAIALGNPRDVMRLAQHLVDRRLVRYQAGAWSLPDRIDGGDLPSSMAQSMQESAKRLGTDARTFAQALALSPEQQFTYAECLILAGRCAHGQLVSLLDELARADVIKRSTERCGLGQHAWAHVLRGMLDPEDERRLEQRLAEVFELRDDSIRVARHLLRAGHEQRAVDVLVEHARLSQEQTDPDSERFAKLIESLPQDWLAVYGEALRACARDGRAPKQAFDLASRMSGIVAVTGIADTSHLAGLLRQLEHDSGLDIHASLQGMEAGARLQRTFELAQQRYDQSSEQARVLAPLAAIRQLGRAMIQLSAAGITARDTAFLRTFPSLEPYLVLSPALWVVQHLVEASRVRCAGRDQRARELYRLLIERTSQPDRAGLDESHHRHATFGLKYGLGVMEASLGLRSCLDAAAEIESNPLYCVNAWTLRMVYHLWQGETREAERCRRKADLLRLQSRQRQFFEDSHIPTELAAHVATGELIKVKQSLDRIAALAHEYQGWKPILRYALGEYHRLRGDRAGAAAEFDAAVSGPEGNEHQVWPEAAGSYVATLIELDRNAEALARGAEYLETLETRGYAGETHRIRLPLALAHAKAGAHAEAAAMADAAIAELAGAGATGLRMAVAYRARARVAESAGDLEAQGRHARLLAANLSPAVSPNVLRGSLRSMAPGPLPNQSLIPVEDVSSLSSALSASVVVSAMAQCRDFSERANCCLELLIKCTAARGGALYVAQDGGLTLAAQIGVLDVPPEYEHQARRMIEELTQDDDATRVADVQSIDTADAPRALPEAERYRLVPLSSRSTASERAAAVAVLVLDRGDRFAVSGQLLAELGKLLLE